MNEKREQILKDVNDQLSKLQKTFSRARAAGGIEVQKKHLDTAMDKLTEARWWLEAGIVRK